MNFKLFYIGITCMQLTKSCDKSRIFCVLLVTSKPLNYPVTKEILIKADSGKINKSLVLPTT